MARLKIAARISEMLLLLAGIALLCGTERLRSYTGRFRHHADTFNDQDDTSDWGIGS